MGEVTLFPAAPLAVVVLAGGGSRRLGGVDKTAIEINGRTLLDRVLALWPAGADLVVVGPERPTRLPVTWCRESPPGGGPVSAIAAALPLVAAPLVALVGADMPLLGPAVRLIVDAATSAIDSGEEGAWAVTSSGRPQPLASCMTKASLAAVLPVEVAGQAILPVLQGLRLTEVPAFDDWLLDADTEDDLQRVRELIYRTEGNVDD